MADIILSDLEYSILRFAHDNPDGVKQEDFTGRLAAEQYIFGTKAPEYNDAKDKLFRYGCLVTHFTPPTWSIVITPRGEQVYEEEKQRREGNKESDNIRKLLDKKTLEKTEQDLRMGYWLWKTKWWPMGIAIGSLIAAIISAIYAVRAYNFSVQTDMKQQKQQDSIVKKEELQRQIEVTKHDIYKYSDSLWKIDHKTDTGKKQPPSSP